MSEKKSIPCKWCSDQTTSLGTKECVKDFDKILKLSTNWK